MKNKVTTVFVLAFIAVSFLGPMTWAWSNHMEWVRDFQTMQMERYELHSTWDEVDTNDHQALIDAAENEIVAVMMSGIGGISDEAQDLRIAATDVLYVIRSAAHNDTVPDSAELDQAVKAVAEAQQRLYTAYDKFQSNWFYAMRQTF